MKKRGRGLSFGGRGGGDLFPSTRGEGPLGFHEAGFGRVGGKFYSGEKREGNFLFGGKKKKESPLTGGAFWREGVVSRMGVPRGGEFAGGGGQGEGGKKVFFWKGAHRWGKGRTMEESFVFFTKYRAV